MVLENFPLLLELEVVLFLFSIWGAEASFSTVLRASPLLGQIIVGILLGPALADIIPFVSSFQLLGKLGGLQLAW